jgi:hypothetical protein
MSVGIICLTPENWEKAWILFEAGALSKTVFVVSFCHNLHTQRRAAAGTRLITGSFGGVWLLMHNTVGS